VSTEEPTSAPEQPEPKYGDPISEERQAELQAILDAWAAEDGGQPIPWPVDPSGNAPSVQHGRF
jgi:hypothetical protein